METAFQEIIYCFFSFKKKQLFFWHLCQRSIKSRISAIDNLKGMKPLDLVRIQMIIHFNITESTCCSISFLLYLLFWVFFIWVDFLREKKWSVFLCDYLYKRLWALRSRLVWAFIYEYLFTWDFLLTLEKCKLSYLKVYLGRSNNGAVCSIPT